MKIKLLIIALFLSSINIYAQNIELAKQIIDTLCSPSMHGRGYEFNGDGIAAEYLSNQLKKMNVQPFEKSYYQFFNVDVNTFPSDVFVKIDGKELTPGEDYLIRKNSNSCEGIFEVEIVDKNIISNKKKFRKFASKKHLEKFILLDTNGLNDSDFASVYQDIINSNSLHAKGLIIISESGLLHSVSTEVLDYPVIIIKRESLPKEIKKIEVKIKNEFIENYKTQNLVGFVRGEIDSFIVFTAHYDHLGSMGKDTYFPGAHDNASGVAMCLNLIKEFSNRKTIPHYSIAIILFSGEELGLLGSYNYVINPVFPLENIKFLINIDMAGSGEDGIQIVNSTIFKDEYNLLKKINEENDLMKEIKTRGAAANSDHYFFYEAGVPCFFIYTLGAYKEYHNIYDKAETLPLNDYEDYFRLLEKFVDSY